MGKINICGLCEVRRRAAKMTSNGLFMASKTYKECKEEKNKWPFTFHGCSIKMKAWIIALEKMHGAKTN